MVEGGWGAERRSREMVWKTEGFYRPTRKSFLDFKGKRTLFSDCLDGSNTRVKTLSGGCYGTQESDGEIGDAKWGEESHHRITSGFIYSRPDLRAFVDIQVFLSQFISQTNIRYLIILAYKIILPSPFLLLPSLFLLPLLPPFLFIPFMLQVSLLRMEMLILPRKGHCLVTIDLAGNNKNLKVS